MRWSRGRWRRAYYFQDHGAYRPPMSPRRGFCKCERRCFCMCEMCRLQFGRRLLYNRFKSGKPLGLGWRWQVRA